MNSPALLMAQRIENRLGDLYELLHAKERQAASRINRYAEKKSYHERTHTFALNITLNLCVLVGLFYLLY